MAYLWEECVLILFFIFITVICISYVMWDNDSTDKNNINCYIFI